MVAMDRVQDFEETAQVGCAKAKEVAGGPVALAISLTESGAPISSQAISKWDRVPADRVLDVERITGVSRHDLRPDVFGLAEVQS